MSPRRDDIVLTDKFGNEEYLDCRIVVCSVLDAIKEELSPLERIFVVFKTLDAYNTDALGDFYLECGCFEEAARLFAKCSDARKLGDIAWAAGNHQLALKRYKSEEEQCWDRIIKLSFYLGDWRRFFSVLSSARIEPGIAPGHIMIGFFDTSATVYLEMLAQALRHCPEIDERQWETWVLENVQIGAERWHHIREKAIGYSRRPAGDLKKRIQPRIARTQALSLEEACRMGATKRAKDVLSFLSKADKWLLDAYSAVRRFLRKGRDADLQEYIGILQYCGIRSTLETLFFESIGKLVSHLVSQRVFPTDRWLSLFSSHPLILRKTFGEYLNLKMTEDIPLTARDLLTGVFQNAYSIEEEVKRIEKPSKSSPENRLSIEHLGMFEDWAESILPEWIEKEGKKEIQEVCNVWKTGKARPVKDPWNGTRRAARDPREMHEWKKMLKSSHNWLANHYIKEIGDAQWKRESALFALARRTFKNAIRHAMPVWLAPQHLDIFLPDQNAAIEYNGRQHYEAVGFFGGEAGFRATTTRDEIKKRVCSENGVHLFFVRWDESLSERLAEIEHSLSHCVD